MKRKNVLKQMQYRFAVIYETLGIYEPEVALLIFYVLKIRRNALMDEIMYESMNEIIN